MLDPKLEKALNDQINKELQAWYAYLSMAALLRLDAPDRLRGVHGRAEPGGADAREPAHPLRPGPGRPRGPAPDLPARRSVQDDPRHLRDSLEQERANTRAIYELYDLAKGLNDYATVAHLQWFLDEQVEEEKVMSDAVGLLKFAGDDKSALLSLQPRVRLPEVRRIREGLAAPVALAAAVPVAAARLLRGQGGRRGAAGEALGRSHGLLQLPHRERLHPRGGIGFLRASLLHGGTFAAPRET
jgi:ferritin